MQKFLGKINQVNSAAVILSVVEPFAKNRATIEVENLPMKLEDLYTVEYENLSLTELLALDVTLTLTDSEQQAVETVTRNQSRSSDWHSYRAGRITASNFRSVCVTSINKPSLSLLKRICYPARCAFKTADVKYGLDHEDIARKAYSELMKKQHQNVTIKNTGLVISLKDPAFAASPDGIVTCSCCKSGCIEIKCPSRLKKYKIDEWARLNDTCLRYSDSGNLHVDKNHAHYYQMHLQMFVTNLPYCDFVIWSKTELFLERIFFDNGFFQENFIKAKIFHERVIIPELLAKFYSSFRRSLPEDIYCDCDKPADGQPMVQCSNEACTIKFFHLECTGLSEVGDDTSYLCQSCTQILINELQ